MSQRRQKLGFKLTPEQQKRLARLAPNARAGYLQALKKQAQAAGQYESPSNSEMDMSVKDDTSIAGSPRNTSSSKEKKPKKTSKKSSGFGGLFGKKKDRSNSSVSAASADESESEDDSVPALTLELVVGSTYISKLFLEYTQSLFCDENLRLYFHLIALDNDLERMTPVEFQSQSFFIIQRFLAVGGQSEVNISDEMRGLLVEQTSDKDAELEKTWFHPLRAEIEALLRNDSLLKFCHSDFLFKNRSKVKEVLAGEMDNKVLLAEYSCLEQSLVEDSSTAVDKTIDDGDDVDP